MYLNIFLKGRGLESFWLRKSILRNTPPALPTINTLQVRITNTIKKKKKDTGLSTLSQVVPLWDFMHRAFRAPSFTPRHVSPSAPHSEPAFCLSLWTVHLSLERRKSLSHWDGKSKLSKSLLAHLI